MNPLVYSMPSQIPFAPARTAQTIVLLGDSITALNGGYASSTYSDYKCTGIFNRFNIKAGQPFQILNNAAQGGIGTQAMLDRLDSQVLSYNPGWVYLHAGTNDLGLLSAAQIVANIKAIVTRIRASGARVILCTILPKEGQSQSLAEEMCAVNWWIKDYAEVTHGIYLVDYFKYMLDTSSTDRANACAPISAYLSDGTHPNSTGAKVLGEGALYNALIGHVQPCSLHPVAGVGSSAGDKNVVLNKNPLMLQGTGGTTGSGASGIVAEGWTCERENSASAISVVASLVDRTAAPAYFQDGVPGFVQKLSLSGSTDATAKIRFCQMLWSPPYTADSYVTETEVYASFTTGYLTIADTNATVITTTGNTFVIRQNSDTLSSKDTVLSGVMRSPRFTLPTAGVQVIGDYIEFATSPGAIGDVYIGYHVLRKTTQ